MYTVIIAERNCIYWYLFNCCRLKIDFVTQFFVSPVKFSQTDIQQLYPKLTILPQVLYGMLIKSFYCKSYE